MRSNRRGAKKRHILANTAATGQPIAASAGYTASIPIYNADLPPRKSNGSTAGRPGNSDRLPLGIKNKKVLPHRDQRECMNPDVFLRALYILYG